MRLLNAKTRVLKNFIANKVPEYAILSHTWETEEVTFEDLKSESCRKLAGYKKIDYLCRQALKDKLEYVWIDTCCIDKSSSAELSEAINSMYEWYRRAKICYAYLSDVKTAPDNDPSEFTNSRWFKRGWTLQELLAPREINFYGAEWTPMGRKGLLIELLSKITYIDEQALRNPRLLPYFSIARRLSWAAMRKTTRVEDQAYSLLGLFQIHIPLLYGEGRNAFRRLQEELVRVSNDQSVFVHTGIELFADDPVEFLHSAKVMPIQCTKSPEVYRMTSKGLNIQLRCIIDRKSSRTIGILDCRIQGDLENYIGISLLASRANIYQRDVFTTDTGNGSFEILPGFEEEGSCLLIPGKQVAGSKRQEIFIHPELAILEHLTFKVQTHSIADYGLRLKPPECTGVHRVHTDGVNYENYSKSQRRLAFPRTHSWYPESQVLETTTDDDTVIFATLTFLDAKEKLVFGLVIYAIVSSTWSRLVAFKELAADGQPMILGRPMMDTWSDQATVQITHAHPRGSFSEERLYEITATATTKVMLDQNVCVVDVDMKPLDGEN